MSQLSRQIRLTLYMLKQHYPGQIDIYKVISSETDPRTGQKLITKEVHRVRRAIVLPSKVLREVVRNISIISANKEFVAGGTYDVGTREFIVDRRDVPGLTSLTSDDWLVYGGKKYQIARVEEFEPSAGWIITARALEGEVPEQILVAQADDRVRLADGAVSEN